MSEEVTIDKPTIMNKRVAELVKYHLKKEKIVYKFDETEYEIIYMLKSIKRDAQTYNVVYNKDHNTWVCECPAFKFRRRLKAELCKHCDFIKVLIEAKIPIESM